MTNNITVVGAGTMGWQIALMFAIRGNQVKLLDASSTVAHQSADVIRRTVRELVEESLLPAGSVENLGGLAVSDSLERAVSDCDMVIECVPEDVEIKRALFAEISEYSPTAILATNSSSLGSSVLADSVTNPGRLMNAHFYRMPWLRPVVEVMSCGSTSDEAMARGRELLEGSGFRVFALSKESRGFIYNRIWRAIKRESLEIVADGVATVEEVDEIWEMISPRPPLGPFKRMDGVGLDTTLAIEKNYVDGIDDPVIELLSGLLEQGRLGVKSGRGFYDYTAPSAGSSAAD